MRKNNSKQQNPCKANEMQFIGQYILIGEKADFMKTHMSGLLDLLEGR